MPDRAVFFDRDNTLIEDPGYISHPSQVKLLPGAAEALARIKKLGYKLVVVSNQSGVARGIVSEKVLQEIHHRLQQLLAVEGALLDKIFYCPYHPAGVVEKYRRESDLRKPSPGMLLMAAEQMDLDLSRCWMVGDTYDDITAGHRADCRTILINPPPKYKLPAAGQPKPDYQAVNIKEAANIIRRYTQAESQTPPETQTPAEPEVTAAPQAETSRPQETEKTESPDIEAGADLQQESMEAAAESVQESAEAASPEPTAGKTPTTEPAAPAPPAEPKTERREQSTELQPTPQAETETEQLPPPEPRERQPEDIKPLLREILSTLKQLQRQEMYEEFSGLKLVAGILQMVVLFCLLLGVWFLLDTAANADSVLIALGFAAVLQLITLTLYLMHGRK